VRIHLAGRVMVESDELLLDEEQLPARQGRIAFAYLVLQRRRPVARQELAEAIWGEEVPEAWDAGVSALLSRLRSLFRRCGMDIDIVTLSRSVDLRMPEGAWVDIDAARNALDEAKGLVRAGRPDHAWPHAAVAFSVTERGFLEGEELPWIVRERERLRAQHIEVLECLSDVTLQLGEPSLALRHARQCIEMEPFRESAYEREMRAHISLGNRAEALRTYELLRKLLATELGADPSPSVHAVYLEALGP
jgi:DNA-binding SARP family transcriptional activator